VPSLFPHAPTPYRGLSLASRRGRLGPLPGLSQLHRYLPRRRCPIQGLLPSSSVPRSTQVPVPLYGGRFPLDSETVLWPRLTPATSPRPHDQACHLRWLGDRSPQVSALAFPASLPHLPHQPLTYFGLRCFWPARPTDTASHEVRVPQVAGLLPASSRPHLTVTPLPSANGWRASTSAGVSHSLVNAHAGRTRERRGVTSPPPLYAYDYPHCLLETLKETPKSEYLTRQAQMELL
jgi:hypothetical protein